jgi:hypothetical protein
MEKNLKSEIIKNKEKIIEEKDKQFDEVRT